VRGASVKRLLWTQLQAAGAAEAGWKLLVARQGRRPIGAKIAAFSGI
jgi:hypothetical protein